MPWLEESMCLRSMSNPHVDTMIYELARTAILMRMSAVSGELRQAREAAALEQVAELQAASLALWEELYNLPANQPKVCACVVRKYSSNMVQAQSVLRELNKLRLP